MKKILVFIGLVFSICFSGLSQEYTIANAGSNDTICVSNLPYKRTGNGIILGLETASWSTISGPTGFNYSSTDQTLTVPDGAAPGTYEFDYVIDNSVNGTTADAFVLTIEKESSAATVEGGFLTYFYETCDVSQVINADVPEYGEGFWRVIAGPGKIKVGDESSPTAIIENLILNTTTVLEWVVTNGECGESTPALVTIEQKGNITDPYVSVNGNFVLDGQALDVCKGETILIEGAAPNAVNGEAGQWSGTAGLVSSTPTESITFTEAKTVNATWTISSVVPGCPEKLRTITFNVYDVPAQPVITGPTEVCEGSEEIYSVSSVNEDTDYTWSVSDPNVIISGVGSQDVMVAFSSETSSSETSTSVQIEVTANNECGSSSPAILNVEKSKCSVVGFTNEPAENSYKLYPNPFTTSFNLTGIQDFQKIEVYNVSGQLVESYTSKNDLGLTLPKGNYVLKIQTSTGVDYKKVVKR